VYNYPRDYTIMKLYGVATEGPAAPKWLISSNEVTFAHPDARLVTALVARTEARRRRKKNRKPGRIVKILWLRVSYLRPG